MRDLLKNYSLKKIGVFCFFIAIWSVALSQNCTIKGTVKDSSGNPVSGATINLQNTATDLTTNQFGGYIFRKIKPGSYEIIISNVNFQTVARHIPVHQNEKAVEDFVVVYKEGQLPEIIIAGIKNITGMGQIDEVHDGVIYSGKKTEVLLLDSLNANTAQDNTRQVLGR